MSYIVVTVNKIEPVRSVHTFDTFLHARRHFFDKLEIIRMMCDIDDKGDRWLDSEVNLPWQVHIKKYALSFVEVNEYDYKVYCIKSGNLLGTLTAPYVGRAQNLNGAPFKSQVRIHQNGKFYLFNIDDDDGKASEIVLHARDAASLQQLPNFIEENDQ